MKLILVLSLMLVLSGCTHTEQAIFDNYTNFKSTLIGYDYIVDESGTVPNFFIGSPDDYIEISTFKIDENIKNINVTIKVTDNLENNILNNFQLFEEMNIINLDNKKETIINEVLESNLSYDKALVYEIDNVLVNISKINDLLIISYSVNE